MIHYILYLFENIVQFNVYMCNITLNWAVPSIKSSEFTEQKIELPVYVTDGLEK
jgi:hypothetical protein